MTSGWNVLRNVLAGYVGFFATRIRRNSPGFVGEFFPYILLAVAAASLDFVSTCRFMLAGGVEDEFHPVIRLVSRVAGPIAGPAIGKVCQLATLALVTVTFRRFARVIFIPVILTYLFAAWYNTWGVHIYTPWFLQVLS